MGGYFSKTDTEETLKEDYNIFDSSLPTIFGQRDFDSDTPQINNTNCRGCQKKQTVRRVDKMKTEREILRDLKYIKISLKRLHQKLAD